MIVRLRNLKTNWPQVLWGLLLLAFAGNLVYLLWPNPPAALVLSPHPETMKVHTMPETVLVESSTANEKAYLLVQTTANSEAHATTKVSRYMAKKSNAYATKPLTKQKININTASLGQLQQLPGVGPKMAARIAAYRKVHGPFKALEDLQEISGIGPKKLARLLPYCTL